MFLKANDNTGAPKEVGCNYFVSVPSPCPSGIPLPEGEGTFLNKFVLSIQRKASFSLWEKVPEGRMRADFVTHPTFLGAPDNTHK